ncbi:MAG: ABC transporter permease [Bacteroidetes bacterium]|nr:ABC transporter permease [Bacteroidota bacterium]MBI3481806.1 ABC transporter permease [Bacteroidota bacterium]
MTKLYFILAFRSIIKHKLFSLINIIGLSIGLAVCLTIFSIVKYEFSFDKFQEDQSRIYRIYSEFKGAFSGLSGGVPAALAGATKDEIAGLQTLAGFHSWSCNVYVLNGSERKDFYKQERIIFAGPDFFDLFKDYKWIEGSPSTSLSKPFQVVLSESQARTYFGTPNPHEAIGKEIHYRDSLLVTVAGIVSDQTGNTDIDFTDFISVGTVSNSWLKANIRFDDWGSINSSSQLFIKLLPDVAPNQVEQQLRKLYKAHTEQNNAMNVEFGLQRLSDLHFNADIGIFDHSRSAASIPTLRILIAVAFLILAIASINFVNLETALASQRAKEVGVRKIFGSSRMALVLHFITRSFVLTSFATAISLLLSALAPSLFTDLISPNVQLDLGNSLTIFFLVVLVMVTTLFAGFFPALALSSLQPIRALRNQIGARSNYKGTGAVRKTLIVFQFTLTQVLLLATIMAIKQINFLINKDLGFRKNAIIYFDSPWWEKRDKVRLLKGELEQISGLEEISLNSNPPASTGYATATMKFIDGKSEVESNVFLRFGDTSFVRVYGLKLLAGRNIHKSDNVSEFIVNETYSKLLGFKTPNDAINKELSFGGSKIPIVGVVKDFHFQSLHTPVKPAVIADTEGNFRCFGIKLTEQNGKQEFSSVIEKINQAWKRVYPDQQFNYQFMDQAIHKFYEKEERTNSLIQLATLVSVLISCLGLFGLASFTTIQRTKEIGIRKTLGANVNSILILLSRELITVVLIAFVMSVPISIYIVTEWLRNYAYHTDFSWWVFILTILLAFIVSIASIFYQAIRAASVNPSESLRYE